MVPYHILAGHRIMTSRANKPDQQSVDQNHASDPEALLIAALRLLDCEGAHVAAIHVSTALDALRKSRLEAKPDPH